MDKFNNDTDCTADNKSSDVTADCETTLDYEEYKSGDYCRAIRCPYYDMGTKILCEKCDAYCFHDFLQEQGFKIVRFIKDKTI